MTRSFGLAILVVCVSLLVLRTCAAQTDGPLASRAITLQTFSLAFEPQTNGPIVQFGESYTLHSKVLSQDRPYWVYLPTTYHAKGNGPGYPVLYLLDEWNFPWACELVQFMSDSLDIPEFIVVSIPNKDREHDLTPTHDTNYISSGGGPLFEKFLRDELAPEIDEKFRTIPYRILMGHSAGGTLAADAFLRQTSGFQTYIAIDPALWWDNEVLVRRAKEFIPRRNSRAAIFITTAGLRPTAGYLRLNPTNAMTRAQELFVSILRTNSSPGIRVGYEVESEDHMSSRLFGLYDGLRFIFDGYKPVDPLLLSTPSLINDHFKQLSDRLGIQIVPPESLVGRIGYGLMDAHEPDKAIACFKLDVRNYPTSAYAYSRLGDAYSAKDEKQLAIQNYKKALELDPGMDSVKEALGKLR